MSLLATCCLCSFQLHVLNGAFSYIIKLLYSVGYIWNPGPGNHTDFLGGQFPQRNHNNRLVRIEGLSSRRRLVGKHFLAQRDHHSLQSHTEFVLFRFRSRQKGRC